MLISNLPRTKNGRKAPISTAATSIHSTICPGLITDARKATRYRKRSTVRIVSIFLAAPVSCSFSLICMKYNTATHKSITSMARLKVVAISSQSVLMVFAI